MGWFLVLVTVGFVAFVAIDIARFAKASKPDGVKVDAGGVLFVQGNATYYRLPSGQRRKIADYPFDLTPGSDDMRAFLGVMDKALRDKQAEASNKRKAALNNMAKVAKEENK